MIYLLDTTLLIDHAAGRPSAVELMFRLFENGGELWTCDVIVCEALSAGTAEQRREIGLLIDALEYVSTHPEAARWAGRSRQARGQSSHRTVGDALIAGVAWFHDATIVTRNPEDFIAQGVPVLTYD